MNFARCLGSRLIFPCESRRTPADVWLDGAWWCVDPLDELERDPVAEWLR
jgi:hypothetical protein